MELYGFRPVHGEKNGSIWPEGEGRAGKVAGRVKGGTRRGDHIAFAAKTEKNSETCGPEGEVGGVQEV